MKQQPSIRTFVLLAVAAIYSSLPSPTNGFSPSITITSTTTINKNSVRSSITTTALNAAAAPLEEGSTVVVCTGPTCSQKGSKKALAIMQELAPTLGVTVETIKCVSECAECAMGPNVEVRRAGDDGPFFPIKNGVRTEEDVKKVLGLE